MLPPTAAARADASCASLLEIVLPRALDTTREAEAVQIAALRRLSPAQKMAQVLGLNRALRELVSARLRRELGEFSEGELTIRLAALTLPRDLFRAAYGRAAGSEA